jgi:hypothetical protein
MGALTLPWLGACGSTPLPLVQAPSPPGAGAARLMDSAVAHGLTAYRQLTDINISYGGQWRPFIGRIQPEVVDAGFRGPSEERLMPRLGINAQAYRGPSGTKQVWWQRGQAKGADGQVRVWHNDQPTTRPAALAAAALVAECYGLFLLGPLWLVDRQLPSALKGRETVDGRDCDVIQVWLQPGLGLVDSDRAELCVDRANSLTRRMRFTLEGYTGTQGAVAETDTFDHQMRDGILWPMRSFERVLHPIRLPAHDWFVTGLDVNRGYDAAALSGPRFTGAAAAPARPI